MSKRVESLEHERYSTAGHCVQYHLTTATLDLAFNWLRT